MFDAEMLAEGEVTDRFRELELERRRREVELALLVGEIERRELYSADGMRTALAWCRGIPRWSHGEAKHAHRIARLLRTHSDVLTPEAAAQIPVAHLREIARAAANPRCGGEIGDALPVIMFWGEQLDYDAFHKVVQHWERRADVDGTGEAHEESHERRQLSVITSETGAHLSGRLGSLQAAIFTEILDRFCQAEFLADWEWTKREYGESATPDKMPRTARQRRADALVEMAVRAASMPLDARPPEPLVFVIAYEDLQDATRRRASTVAGPSSTDPEGGADEPVAGAGDDLESDAADGFADEREPSDPGEPAWADDPARAPDEQQPAPPPSRRPPGPDPSRWRCQSRLGVPLDPDDVFTAAVLGHVRRVVLDSASVVVDVGRRSRLFTGPIRDALLVTGGRCTCRGCLNRHRLEVDHIIPWKEAGETNADNGNPRCRWHNLIKNKGFTAHRDADGIWHYYRPDKTEITSI